MKQQARELLVTARVADSWMDRFDERAEQLMGMLGKTDTLKNVEGASEVIDVYHKRIQRPGKVCKKKTYECCGKPFEFMVFRN